jgi:two-component sensor histidine kinase
MGSSWSRLKRAALRPSTIGDALIASTFVYTPILTGVSMYLFGGSEDFLARWLRGNAIGATVGLQCILGVALVQRIETAIRVRLGRPPVVHRRSWYLGLAVVLAAFALPGGFFAGGLVSLALGRPYRAPDLGSYRVGLAFGVITACAFFAHRTLMEDREAIATAKDRIRELETKRLEAQLAALTAEMNPHLLFNALNTVAALIHQDPDRAEDTVVKLADLYRGVLRASGSATHPLADELRLCDAYLHVEKARFGDRLAVSIDVASNVEPKTPVPVLILQPFIENAVKHGVAPKTAGGTVSLRLERDGDLLRATVDDDGVGLGSSPAKGAGRALANCRERLALGFGDRGRVELVARPEGGTRVTVEMPLS